MKLNDSPLVEPSNGFEGRCHAEFDRESPPVQSEQPRLSCGLSRRRGEPLPRLWPDALDHRPAVGRMRFLLDRVAAQGSDDLWSGCGAGILALAPGLRRPPGRLRGLNSPVPPAR